jgi:hypothetical protein
MTSTDTSTEIVRSRVAPCRLLHRRIGSAGESTGLVNDDRLMRI